jgi:hypothetical protein
MVSLTAELFVDDEVTVDFSDGEFDFDFRIQCLDSTLKWVNCRGSVAPDELSESEDLCLVPIDTCASISAEVFDYIRASHSGSSSLNSSVSFSSDERPVQRVIKLSGVMQDVTKLQERALSGVQDSEKLRQKEDDVKVVIENDSAARLDFGGKIACHTFRVLAENSSDKLRLYWSC